MHKNIRQVEQNIEKKNTINVCILFKNIRFLIIFFIINSDKLIIKL